MVVVVSLPDALPAVVEVGFERVADVFDEAGVVGAADGEDAPAVLLFVGGEAGADGLESLDDGAGVLRELDEARHEDRHDVRRNDVMVCEVDVVDTV